MASQKPLPERINGPVSCAPMMTGALDQTYAFEELIAEIGNCLICATLGLTPDFAQSGAYIGGWLKAMKDDNRAIFKAASEA